MELIETETAETWIAAGIIVLAGPNPTPQEAERALDEFDEHSIGQAFGEPKSADELRMFISGYAALLGQYRIIQADVMSRHGTTNSDLHKDFTRSTSSVLACLCRRWLRMINHGKSGSNGRNRETP